MSTFQAFIMEADPERVVQALKAAATDIRKGSNTHLVVIGLLGYLCGIIDGGFQGNPQPTGIMDAFVEVVSALTLT